MSVADAWNVEACLYYCSQTEDAQDGRDNPDQQARLEAVAGGGDGFGRDGFDAGLARRC